LMRIINMQWSENWFLERVDRRNCRVCSWEIIKSVSSLISPSFTLKIYQTLRWITRISIFPPNTCCCKRLKKKVWLFYMSSRKTCWWGYDIHTRRTETTDQTCLKRRNLNTAFPWWSCFSYFTNFISDGNHI
jgi:hypothetical protein